MDYTTFLKTKEIIYKASGFNIEKSNLNKMLFDFQKDIVQWAVKAGKAAVFAECGLGKTPIQLEYANQIYKKTKKPVIIFAPLAVVQQTKREGIKFNISINIAENENQIINGINITNYEKIHKFDSSVFSGIILDESSILKGFDGKYRKELNKFAENIDYRLCCTATPSPNDYIELINHAEFLGIMKENEIKALFFIQDGNSSNKWKVKGHAKYDYWKWVASWSVALKKPSDIGDYNDSKFKLPQLNIIESIIKTDYKLSKGFFSVQANTMNERREVRRNTADKRAEKCAELVNNSNDQWLVWCDLNYESELLHKYINDSVEVRGSDTDEHKINSVVDFQNKKIKCLIAKPQMFGFGLNLQNCHNMAFVGLSDSYERLYQATRRCWRFGQKETVNCYHIISNLEGKVIENIKRKEKESEELFENVIKYMNLVGQLQVKRNEMEYKMDKKEGTNWTLYQGDSIEMINNIKDNSIGLSVFSPPFPGMYAYTNSSRDMGNCKNFNELIEQYKFLAPKILQKTMPGRNCCVHLTQGVAFKSKDGWIGLKDFRGKIIEAMEESGWIYYGETCIDKDPQLKAIRTKDRGLMFKTLSKDSSVMHCALADYLLQFMKPGENPYNIQASKTINNENGWVTPDEWIEWAAPVWYRATKNYPGGIKETDVLQTKYAKDNNDEKHLCPLQLGVIERAVKMWSNPNDTIFSPFAGIGSEGYISLQLERKFIGIELKQSYFDQAVKNLKATEKKKKGFNLNLHQSNKPSKNIL